MWCLSLKLVVGFISFFRLGVVTSFLSRIEVLSDVSGFLHEKKCLSQKGLQRIYKACNVVWQGRWKSVCPNSRCFGPNAFKHGLP